MLDAPGCKFHDFILRLIDSHKLAVLHLQNAVHVLAHAQVVSDDDASAVVFMDEVSEGFHDLKGALGIEGGGRLVCQHDGGVVDQSTSNSDTLLLSAGKLGREVVQPIIQPKA